MPGGRLMLTIVIWMNSEMEQFEDDKVELIKTEKGLSNL